LLVTVRVPSLQRPPPPPAPLTGTTVLFLRVLLVSVRRPLLAMPPQKSFAKLPLTMLSVRVRVPLLRMPPPKLPPPPLRVRPSSVREPVAPTCIRRNAGALACRSILVVSAPAPVMVRVLVTDGRPFGPSVVLCTVVRV